MPQVSLSTSTSFEGDLNALLEDQGTALTVRFDLDEPAPAGGLKVYIDSEVEQILNRLDLPGAIANPQVENLNLLATQTNFDNSGLAVEITEGATFATVTLNVFDNAEPDTFLPETFDGRVDAVLSLVTADQIAAEDQGSITGVSDYTIDPDAASSTVVFADDASQLTDAPPEPPATPEPPTPPTPPTGDGLQVSLFTGPDYLIENEGTVGAHAFLVTGGIIPEGGLIVSVDAPNLSEFDLSGISVDGGEIEAVRDGGFDLRMTEYTTLVNLPIAVDGEAETGETASFSLATGDGYEIAADYSGGTFNLVDTRADIPLGVVVEPNDIIGIATDTGITPDNPSFSAADSIYFDIGNRYLNEDGTYTYLDYNEDVDLYKLELSAGDTVAAEVFEGEGNITRVNVGFISGLAAFDADGNQIISSNNDITPAAPDKLFGTVGGQALFGAYNEDGTVNFDETEAYLEFTAPEDGIYYIGVSGVASSVPNTYAGVETPYNIEAPGLGQENKIAFGNYAVEIDLLTPDNPRKTGTPTPPVSNPDVTDPPTLSLSANPITEDSEGNITPGVVEFIETGGVSRVNFIVRAEGDIPEEGIEFVLNSDANLFDYVSYYQQDLLPSSIGGQSLGSFYNEDGIPTGIRLLIEEPTMVVTLEAANRADGGFEFFGIEPLLDVYEPLETDGAEDVTFSLLPGEGYEIAPDASTAEVTYYDSVEDVPAVTGGGDMIPVVGVTVSESTLIESEQTETTLTFTLSEPPPAEGVTVLLDSDDEVIVGSVLSQFDVLEAEIEGGNFPLPNADVSGFFFTITEQTATITLSVFDELTVDTGLPADSFQEGILDLTFALESQPGYTIDPNASEINFSILDNLDSQILVTPTAATVDDEESATLIESEGTVGVLNLGLGATPPAEGLTVSVSTDALADFDTDAIEVAGGTIANLRNDGFDVTLTERQASVSLPILDDGIEEGSETATFTVEPSDTYETVQIASEVSFFLGDTLGQGSAPEEIEENSILSDANALGLSVSNPAVSISGGLSNSFEDFIPGVFFSYVEDVDFYSFTLEAGQTVALDIDGSEDFSDIEGFPDALIFPAFQDIPQQPDHELRLFDADGNELAANSDGAAPGEDFSRDPYLEFTAETAGTYYVGISQLGNDNYDPNVFNSGSGWTFPEVGVFFGNYELTATLTDGDIQPPTVTPTPGADTLTGTEADDTLFGDLGNDVITGGDGDDILRGDLNDRSPQDDVMGGNDIIFGGEGNDRIGGKSGNDILSGDAGDDFIWGDDGDDIIMGVSGNDTLVGDNFSDGSGSDLFVFGNGDGTDTILDFEVGSDRIGLVEGELLFADLTITQDGNNTLLGVSSTGETLAILNNIQASALSESSFETVADVSNPEEAMALI